MRLRDGNRVVKTGAARRMFIHFYLARAQSRLRRRFSRGAVALVYVVPLPSGARPRPEAQA